MTTVRVHRLTGDTPAVSPKLRIHRITGTGTTAVTPKLRIHRLAGTGSNQPSLAAPQTEYEPGDLVQITVSNPTGPDTAWKITGLTPAPTLLVEGALCSLTAPATKSGTSLTLQYGATAFLTIRIGPAFWLIGGRPAIVRVNVP